MWNMARSQCLMVSLISPFLKLRVVQEGQTLTLSQDLLAHFVLTLDIYAYDQHVKEYQRSSTDSLGKNMWQFRRDFSS